MTHDEELIEKAASENNAHLKSVKRVETSGMSAWARCANSFKAGVSWRDQNPKPVEGRTDSERLEWMIKNEAMVSKVEGAHWCEIKKGSRVISYCELDPREAIDAAMDQETKRGDAREL